MTRIDLMGGHPRRASQHGGVRVAHLQWMLGMFRIDVDALN